MIFCWTGVKVCVYLMTNVALHMELEGGQTATVQDLTQAIFTDDQLRIPRTASNVFTLWMSSGLLGWYTVKLLLFNRIFLLYFWLYDWYFDYGSVGRLSSQVARSPSIIILLFKSTVFTSTKYIFSARNSLFLTIVLIIRLSRNDYNFLELQLKPHHKPLAIRSKWISLLNKYAHASESRQRRDEPVMTFQRNIYFPKSQEERIK